MKKLFRATYDRPDGHTYYSKPFRYVAASDLPSAFRIAVSNPPAKSGDLISVEHINDEVLIED